MIKRLKRWLIMGHRWLGIVTCLFFALWVAAVAAGVITIAAAGAGAAAGRVKVVSAAASPRGD